MIQEITEILARFERFNDGLLRTIHIGYNELGERAIAVVVHGRDWRDAAGTWKEVRISLEQVQEYRFNEPRRTTSQVLSNGIHFVQDGSTVGIDLGGLADPPGSLDELRESDMYIIAKVIGCSDLT